MKKKETLDFCNRWLPTWGGDRPNELIDFYSDDALYFDPANKAGLRGHEEILPYFKKLLSANPKWKWEPVEVYSTDLGFVAKWRATIPVGTETVVEDGMDIVEVKHGKITRNEVYFDRSALLDALRKLKSGK